jgi:hypothetical protein
MQSNITTSKLKIKVVISVSILLSCLITLFLVYSICVAFVSTNRLLEAGISSVNGIKLDNSLWANYPRWVVAIIAGVIGIISFPAFLLLFMSMFRRLFFPKK